MFFNSIALSTALLAGTSMASLLWDGRFTANSAAEIDKWSWNNQVGAYQYYIHGSGATADYINISPSYANPADTSSTDGLRLTVDSTSSWNGQTMMRTELIPSTKSSINTGKKFYHFSLKRSATNAPDATAEHQIAFFESHFTELKYGVSGSEGKLQWMTDGKAQFSVDFDADKWQNFAYGIDFSAKTVELYHSTGAEALVKKSEAVGAAVSSNGQDWHVGVLKFSETKEDWFWSGVYIEDGEITTSVAGPGGEEGKVAAASSSVAAVSTAAAASSSVAPPPSSSVAAVSSKAPSSSTAPSKAPISSSSVAAASPSSSKAALSSSSVVAAASSFKVAPTTLQTMTRPASTYTTAPSSTTLAASTSTSASAVAAPTSGNDDGCAVEYVYV